MKLSDTLVLATFGLGLLLSLTVPLVDDDEATPVQYFAALKGIEIGPSDIVVVQPPWRDDVVAELKKPHPEWNVRLAVAKKSVQPLRDIVVVRDATFELPRAWRRVATELRDTGPVIVERLRATVEGAERLLSGIERAQVVVTDANNKDTACTWDAQQRRHTCAPHPDWVWVGEREVTSGDTTRTCFWSHPVAQGHVKTTFIGVDPTVPLTLVTGFRQTALRKRDGASVVVVARANGQKVARLRQRNVAGFSETEVQLSAYKSPVDLEIDVTTSDDGMRHFCFALDVAP